MSVAASLPPTSRKSLAIEVLSQAELVSHLAAQHRARVAMEQECTLRLQALSTLRSSYRIRQSHLGRAKDEAHPASNAQLKQTDNVPTY